MKIFNETTCKLDEFDVNVTRYVKSIYSTDKMVVANEKLIFKYADSGKKLPSEFQFDMLNAVDRRTNTHLPEYGDINRSGNWGFPIYTQKQTYRIWNIEKEDAYKKGYIHDATGRAHFVQEERIDGMIVYKFEGSETDEYIGPGPPNTPNGTIMTYTGSATVWVEPTSGFIVDIVREHSRKLNITADVRVLPENLNYFINLTGSLKIFNETTLTHDIIDVAGLKHIWVDDITNGVYLIRTTTEFFNRTTKEPVEKFIAPNYRFLIQPLVADTVDGVDPKSCEIISNYSDITREGLYTFPIGVEKKSYELWHSELNTTCSAQFMYVTQVNNLNVYVFVQTDRMKIADMPLPLEGIDGVINIYYNGTNIYYVEPTTGMVVDFKMFSKRDFVFPDLRYIPHDLNETYLFEGKVFERGETKLQKIFKNVTVLNFTYIDGRKILSVYDCTTIIDERGNLLFITETFEVDAKSCEIIDKDCLYTFPVGVEKNTYSIWNSEINTSSDAKFIYETVIDGLNVYVFEVNESDRKVSLPYRDIAYYSANIKYYVEPNTGMIVYLEHESELKDEFKNHLYNWYFQMHDNVSKKLVENANFLKDRIVLSESTIVGAEITLKFTKSDVISFVKNATQFSKLVKLAEEPFVVFSLYYKMTDESRVFCMKEAMKYRNLLIFGAIGFPITLITIATLIFIVGSYKLMKADRNSKRKN
jgi:hypothetical protein